MMPGRAVRRGMPFVEATGRRRPAVAAPAATTAVAAGDAPVQQENW